MFKHIFKLTWNRRKQNFLFLAEILVSFIVIFSVSSLLIFYYSNYQKPAGLDDRRVWVVGFGGLLQHKSADSVQLMMENLNRNLRSLPQVEDLAYTSSNFPYANSMSTTGINYEGKAVWPVNTFDVDERFEATTGMKVVEGRWFTKEDGILQNNKLVINASLKKALFGDGPAVGKVSKDEKGNDRWQIIGVVEDVKVFGDYVSGGYSTYKKLDTGTYEQVGHVLLKVSEDANAAFESQLNKLLAATLKDANLEIQHLDEIRAAKNQESIIPMIICITVAGFLIVNVALGLFGVLWYNISQRRSEIGLRRAIGASGKSVALQLIYESMMLSSLSIAAGTFFAIQFPLLNVFDVASSVYLTAIGLSIVVIYLLVIICSLYPGSQAAAIHPAIALHEE